MILCEKNTFNTFTNLIFLAFSFASRTNVSELEEVNVLRRCQCAQKEPMRPEGANVGSLEGGSVFNLISPRA